MEKAKKRAIKVSDKKERKKFNVSHNSYRNFKKIEENLSAKKPLIKTGAEIPFPRCFYKYQKQAKSEDVAARMVALVKEAGEIERRLFG